jgi:membrane-associated phospholipid phosphatase
MLGHAVIVILLTELIGLAAAADAEPLAPLPRVLVFTSAAALDDSGEVSSRGPDQNLAIASGTFAGVKNFGTASVESGNLAEARAGRAPTGLIVAGASGDADEAGGIATLNFWFRVTQTAPFPGDLLGLSVPLTVTAGAAADGTVHGDVWLLDIDETPSGAGNVLHVPTFETEIMLDAFPNQVFQIAEHADASPDCRSPPCRISAIAVDPVISLDQQRFDELAAQRGASSVPLDRYFTLDFSPGLDMLPPISLDLAQMLGLDLSPLLGPAAPSPSAVAEPSALALLLTGLGLLATSLWRARNASAGAIALLAAIGPAQAGEQIELNAGSWKTWVITSGRDFRTPPPSDAGAASEIAELKTLAGQRDAAAKDVIAYWDVGPPSYRWQEIALDETLRNNLPWQIAIRDFALVHAAVYDAMVAAWDSKYAYNRKRPSEIDATLVTALRNPPSPSYPAEHAVAAAAASSVLSYLFPDRAAYFAGKAEEAGRSRLLAGVQYPSDVSAGIALGRKVAALVIERGKTDGTDAKWTGSVPTGPGKWNGTNPILPQMAMWKTWVLDSPSEFRAPPAPAYDSPEKAAELAEIKTFPRTPKTNSAAYFWEYAVGGLRGHQYWADQIGRLVLEYRLENDPPLAARAYALHDIAVTDAGIACWDSKYTYWAIRPFQLDPEVKPLFPTPNHPSYPAAHGCFSTAQAVILGYLFPRDAAALAALAEEAAESRVWAGIHYRSDIVAGAALGRAVADKVIERVQKDGSQ